MKLIHCIQCLIVVILCIGINVSKCQVEDKQENGQEVEREAKNMNDRAHARRFSEDFLKEFQNMYFSGNGEAAARLFTDEFLWRADGRKLIDITCPNNETPKVAIRNLDEKNSNDSEDEEEEFLEFDDDGNIIQKVLKDEPKPKQCLSLRVSGKNFDLTVDLNCDD